MHVTGSCIYAGSGVESADRTPAGIVDTEPRLLNSIDRRKDMANRHPTWSKRNWSTVYTLEKMYPRRVVLAFFDAFHAL